MRKKKVAGAKSLERQVAILKIAKEGLEGALTDARRQVLNQRESIARLYKELREERAISQARAEERDLAYPLAAALKITNQPLYDNIEEYARAWARRHEARLGGPDQCAKMPVEGVPGTAVAVHHVAKKAR